MHSLFDVIVIGAGPAGSTAAYYLSRAGLKTLLLDKAEFPRDKTCGDGLTPRALPVLDDMGILPEVSHHGWQLDTLKVYSPSSRSVTFQLQSIPHAPGYALVVPRLKLDNLLKETAVKAGTYFLGNIHVRKAQVAGDEVIVEAEGEKFHGRMAIIATGANTGLLSKLGLLTDNHPMIVAARAYFEDIDQLENGFQFRFDGVVLPGYGWVFPLSSTSANIGAGFVRASKKHAAISVKAGFEKFVGSPRLRTMLTNARQQGPLKSFPIRVDFAQSMTYSHRILLAGEAAGLVNPLTGDGIDYALESGKIAAEHLIAMFKTGDFSLSQLEAYDSHLRRKYQNLFRFCEQVRQFSLHPHRLNMLVAFAARHPKLPAGLVDYVLGAKAVPENLSPFMILKKVIANL